MVSFYYVAFGLFLLHRHLHFKNLGRQTIHLAVSSDTSFDLVTIMELIPSSWTTFIKGSASCDGVLGFELSFFCLEKYHKKELTIKMHM